MSLSPKSIMLFAAGFGTRMGALTKDQPKPMIKVAGQALIDHALGHVVGFDHVVVNTHYHADQIAKHLTGHNITIVHEYPKILETGGGLRNARAHLNSHTVFTMNTDAVWSGPNPLHILSNAWCPETMDALLLCVPKSHAFGHEGEGDFIKTPKSAQRGPGLIYTGAQIIKTDGLDDIESDVFSLNLLWDQMLRDDRLHIHEYTGNWCDVGHAKAIQTAENMLRDRHV